MTDETASAPAGEEEGSEAQPVMLGDLKAVPRWATHMGAIEGALAFLGADEPPGWLYGATGYAFALNIHQQMCPSGPYAWNNGRPDELGRNVGYLVETVASGRGTQFETAQAAAWQMIRRALGEGTPCYAFDFEFGDYFVVHGHDARGYYYRALGSNETRGPVHWQALGTTGNVGVVLACAVRLSDPADVTVAVRDALDFALEMQDWSASAGGGPAYTSGVKGYDTWIAALRRDDTNPHGAAFNAQFWAECRRFAAQFPAEAKERVLRDELDDLFDEAQDLYEDVRDNLVELAALFPMHDSEENLHDAERVRKAAAALARARDAEWEALDVLERIHDAL